MPSNRRKKRQSNFLNKYLDQAFNLVKGERKVIKNGKEKIEDYPYSKYKEDRSVHKEQYASEAFLLSTKIFYLDFLMKNPKKRALCYIKDSLGLTKRDILYNLNNASGPFYANYFNYNPREDDWPRQVNLYNEAELAIILDVPLYQITGNDFHGVQFMEYLISLELNVMSRSNLKEVIQQIRTTQLTSNHRYVKRIIKGFKITRDNDWFPFDRSFLPVRVDYRINQFVTIEIYVPSDSELSYADLIKIKSAFPKELRYIYSYSTPFVNFRKLCFLIADSKDQPSIVAHLEDVEQLSMLRMYTL
ncbi:hypothetical protein [Brevibacillus sp. DP1.3A]|uniref:hypothetical protein n=1 Tax=Brevibacillus sp. DP1.3A TaxID=2738867 RepID=UPI00156ADE5B|nr:hypothetical protein [Brevibacillus sp. DP1.3A]UED72183.1 hypothetical protein HP399_015550 [Brevibacillus sp. DP1.3A]